MGCGLGFSILYCVTLRSTLAEELAQQLSAFFRQLSAGYQHLMVEPGVIQDLQNRPTAPALGSAAA
jgi:hypothetical protein